MKKTLEQLVSALPEIYQTIYGHPNWDKQASRDGNVRLEKIINIYRTLEKKLGRPLRVLDLGCAQGFFSMSLANLGANVQGIDFLQENVNLCNFLAEENKNLSVKFSVGRIEEFIDQLEPDSYDLVIGLSVFHHIVHEHGLHKVQNWLLKLTNCVRAVILELARQEEPLYWGPSQPLDPRELIEQCGFYRLIARFDTHLSHINRPMYVISNNHIIFDDCCYEYDKWTQRPYETANSIHDGSRRYYFSDKIVCKFYQFSTVNGELSSYEKERSLLELEQETAFLNNPPEGMNIPKMILSGSNYEEGWLVMDRLPGRLLFDILNEKEPFDVDGIIIQLLEQLVILEENGLYHDDIRTWNIMVDHDNKLNIIDFGSISSSKKDCVWPENIFQSFVILVNEMIIPDSITGGIFRPAAVSPFQLPTPYSNWIYAFWKKPAELWTFKLLLDLFNTRTQLVSPENEISGVEKWIGSQEKVVMQHQAFIHKFDVLLEDSQKRLTRADNQANASLNLRIRQLEEANASISDKVNLLSEGYKALADNIELQLEMKIYNTKASIEKFNRGLEQKLNSMQQQIETVHSINKEINSITLKQLSNAGSPEIFGDVSSEYEKAQALIEQLQQDNARLYRYIEAIEQSRSWKMTAWWRAIGRPVKMVAKQPIAQTGKKLVKYSLKNTAKYIQKRPVLKSRVIKALRFLGLYNVSIRIYQKCFPLVHAVNIVDQQVQNETLNKHNKEQNLPPVVWDIYSKLKK